MIRSAKSTGSSTDVLSDLTSTKIQAGIDNIAVILPPPSFYFLQETKICQENQNKKYPNNEHKTSK